MSTPQEPTLQMLREVDGNGKGSLLTFLHGAGLIGTEHLAVVLTGADLRGVALRRRADLMGAYLQRAYLQGAASSRQSEVRRTSLTRPSYNAVPANLGEYPFYALR